jgi:hypothetical protein
MGLPRQAERLMKIRATKRQDLLSCGLTQAQPQFRTIAHMRIPIFPRLMLSALLCAGVNSLSAQQSPLPPGIVNFAGEVSHRHWHLFGETQRAELDALNRELREADQQLRDTTDAGGRQTTAEKGLKAANRLLDLVKACPRLVRLDLTASKPAFSPGGPIELPGDTGALLFAIDSGEEGVRFSSTSADLSLPPGESSLVVVEAAAKGITYAVVGLEHVPVQRTTLRVETRRPGLPSVQLPLDVATPRPGRLKLTVISDEDGKPTPAMVRLMWRTDGLQRRPANGIEFATQLDSQGNASGARAANLPGPLNVQFWCVPGPFGMTLAPGVWQVGVRRGVEHEFLFEDITIRSGELVSKSLRPRRWVDMTRQGWWSGDDHVHMRLLSDDDARNLMAWVKAEDVHLANVVKMGDIYRTYFEQRGFGPEFRVSDGSYVLVPGQECPRTHDQIGHTLAMNITAMVRDPEKYFLYDTVFDAVHAQGGLSGYAHVNSGLFHVHRDMSLNVPRAKVDFVEILQFNNLGTDLYYEFLNLGCKLTASAGSDVPWGGTIGEVRAYAFLGRQPFTADNWFAAFGRGRTFTTSGPMLEFTVDDGLPGDEINLKADRSLRIRAKAWGAPGRMAPVKLEIVRLGEVIQSAESSENKSPEAKLDFTLNAGMGFWIAARARAADGTSAHTTPVYVRREGLRFWKYDGLGELLAKREESLRQIESIIAEAKRLDSEGKLEKDRYRKLLATQGDALLERVALARTMYADLRRTAETERPLRTGSGK